MSSELADLCDRLLALRRDPSVGVSGHARAAALSFNAGVESTVNALAAIEEQYVLIPKDQVTVETEYMNDKTRHVFSRGDGGLYTHVRATITTGWRVPDA